MLLRRAGMLKRAREFFESREILEVDTPMLSRFAVSDPHIESVEVSLQLHPDEPWFLHTSPEYCMKRLLAAGYPDIYQICKVFRDGESGRYHQPEFTMVEWYRLDFGLNEIMQDTIEFIEAVLDQDPFAKPPVFLSYAQAFADIAGIDYTTLDAGARDLALVENVAPGLPRDQLTLLHHYPASQAALARICPNDRSVADRFEVYAGTLEIANGYVELVDPKEQIERFGTDQKAREAAGRAQRPIDDAFVSALEHGLPACAGVAVGFDRVLMLSEGVTDIRQVMSFSFNNQDDDD